MHTAGDFLRLALLPVNSKVMDGDSNTCRRKAKISSRLLLKIDFNFDALVTYAKYSSKDRSKPCTLDSQMWNCD